jgi:hypothetical protein
MGRNFTVFCGADEPEKGQLKTQTARGRFAVLFSGAKYGGSVRSCQNGEAFAIAIRTERER